MDDIVQTLINAPEMREGAMWKRVRFQANDTIIRVNDIGDSFFYIEEGQLRVTSFVELDDRRQIQTGIAELYAGTVFGESCIHRSRHRIASVTAVTDCRLIELDGRATSDFLNRFPELGCRFYQTLFDMLMERLHNANIRVGHLMAWGLKSHKIDKYL